MESTGKSDIGTGGLIVDGIFKGYDGPGGRLDVLSDISFSLAADQAMAITGPSGSGKSTLLNLLAALDSPDGGNITLCGIELSELSADQRASYRAENIGMVFQDHLLIDHLSALDNILLAALANSKVDSAAVDRAHQLMKSLSIEDRAKHLPAELSGGQKQRVAIARALINSPRLLLADEPTGQLDSSTSDQVLQLLLENAAECRAMTAIVTHDTALADQIQLRYHLDGGKLIQR